MPGDKQVLIMLCSPNFKAKKVSIKSIIEPEEHWSIWIAEGWLVKKANTRSYSFLAKSWQIEKLD